MNATEDQTHHEIVAARTFLGGARDGVYHFVELMNRPLSLTVMAEGQRLSVTRGLSDRYTLGGPGGPTDPIRLTDSNYLRVSSTLYRDEDAEGRWKSLQTSYQYQLDPEGDRWVFRYDYDRTPINRYPGGHLQMRAFALAERSVLPLDRGLERVHFPTGRISVESVIRLLAEEFSVGTNRPLEVWRPVLSASERAFQEIAHQPQSGPDRLLDAEIADQDY